MIQANWNDQVQVQIIEMHTMGPGYPKIELGGRILWDGITLAEAVRRWLKLPPDDQPLVTIFGTQSFAGAEIAELAKRPDFPKTSS